MAHCDYPYLLRMCNLDVVSQVFLFPEDDEDAGHVVAADAARLLVARTHQLVQQLLHHALQRLY